MCGIAGIYNFDKNENILDELLKMMNKLQHRGKDSYGICFKQLKGNLHKKKERGLIKNIELKDPFRITSCVGHLKYRTSNMSETQEEDIQPITNYNISLSHNGNIPNISGFDSRHIFELIQNYNGTFTNALINVINTIPAAYSLVIQKEDTIYLMKDKYGIRPLSYGFKKNNIYISSETIALEGCYNIEEIESGQIIEIDKKGIREIYKHKETYDHICAFEFIYFMNPYSFYKNILIKTIREQLVNKLVKKETLIPQEDYIVVGVPNSGIVYAEEYCRLLNFKYEQIIMKNTDERTFISSDKEEIKKTCHKKFKYDESKIRGKKIIVIDDTIVRGNVMGYICESLRNYGAQEIHIRIPSPPVIDICQLGISINTKEELIMFNKNEDEVCSTLNADSLVFLEKVDLGIIPFKTYNECFGGGIKKEIISYNC
jgi:amidophosphoribosyltransferase